MIDRPEKALNNGEIYQLLQELSLKGSRIDAIYQDNYEEIVLALYKADSKGYLVIHVGPNSHFYWLDHYRKNRSKLLRFNELLNSKIKNSYLITIEQFQNDRTLLFHVKRHEKSYYLIILLWAKAANIYLCNEDKEDLIDAFYRRAGGKAKEQLKLALEERAEKRALESIRFGPPPIDAAVKEYYQKKIVLAKVQLESIEAEKEQKKNRLLKQQLKISNWQDKESALAQADQEFFAKMDLLGEQSFLEIKQYLARRAVKYQQIQKDRKQYEQLGLRIQELEQEDRSSIENPATSALLRKNKKHSATFLSIKWQSYSFLIGRNRQENDTILRYYTRGLDFWFHVEHASGGFVVVKYQNQAMLPKFILEAAGALAHHFSKKRYHEQVDIYYTQVKDLKRTKELGKVVVLRAKSISSRYDAELIRKILSN